jgi:hypothetical protein
MPSEVRLLLQQTPIIQRQSSTMVNRANTTSNGQIKKQFRIITEQHILYVQLKPTMAAGLDLAVVHKD